MHMLEPSIPSTSGISHSLHLHFSRRLGQSKHQASYKIDPPTTNVPSVCLACSVLVHHVALLRCAHIRVPTGRKSMKRGGPSKDATNSSKDESAPGHEGKRARGVVIDGPIMGADAPNPEESGGASAQLSLSVNQLDMEKPASALNATLAIPIENVEPTFTKEFDQAVEHAGEPGQLTFSGATVADNGGTTLLSNRNDAVVANEGLLNEVEAVITCGGVAAIKDGDGALVRNRGRAVVENGDRETAGNGAVAASGDENVAMVENHGVAAALNGDTGNEGLPLTDAREENRDSDSSDESEVNLDEFFHFSGTNQQVASLKRRFARGIPGRCIAEQLESVANTCGSGAARGGYRFNPVPVGNRRVHANGIGNECAEDPAYGFGPTKDRAERRRFVERYNFDIVNDRPLKGRYHWVRVDEELPAVESSHGANGIANGLRNPDSPSSPRTPTSPISVVTRAPALGTVTESTPTTSATDSADDNETEGATADQVLRVQANGRGHEEVQA